MKTLVKLLLATLLLMGTMSTTLLASGPMPCYPDPCPPVAVK